MWKLFALLLTPILAQEQKPTEPEELNELNKGHCEFANAEYGLTTYTFWVGDVQRCFTVHIPPERKGQFLPVAFQPNCYAGDKLRGFGWTDKALKKGDKDLKAAARYGYAIIAVSNPKSGWSFATKAINVTVPNACEVCTMYFHVHSKYMQHVFRIMIKLIFDISLI